MKHEKIIKREDGTQYKILIYAYVDHYGSDSINYNIELYYRNKGKRKWLDVPDTLNDWEFRNLDMEDRREHTIKNILRFVSTKESYQAKIELWETFKPKE